MAFLIPAGLFIIGLLCCIGIAFLAVQSRTDERKAVAQKAVVTSEKTSLRPTTPTASAISAVSPVSPTSPAPSTSSPVPTNEHVDDATVKRPYNKAIADYMQEETASIPTTEPVEEQKESQSSSSHSNSNGHSEHTELQNLQLYTEMEQIAALFQDGKLLPEWMHEQIQELSVKVQDLHQQSSLVERHITLLNQIAVYMNELEQVRNEYKVLREKRGAVLRIPTRLHGENADGDTYIQTDKRPAMRKYTLKTM